MAACRLNTVEVDGRTWLRVVTNTGDKVHLVMPVDGMPEHCQAQAVPAWGAYVAMLESSTLESSKVELAEIRGHFGAHDPAELAKPRWWIAARCGRRWRHMATAEDEEALRPGTISAWGGARWGDRACSKCGTHEYGDPAPVSVCFADRCAASNGAITADLRSRSCGGARARLAAQR